MTFAKVSGDNDDDIAAVNLKSCFGGMWHC